MIYNNISSAQICTYISDISDIIRVMAIFIILGVFTIVIVIALFFLSFLGVSIRWFRKLLGYFTTISFRRLFFLSFLWLRRFRFDVSLGVRYARFVNSWGILRRFRFDVCLGVCTIFRNFYSSTNVSVNKIRSRWTPTAILQQYNDPDVFSTAIQHRSDFPVTSTLSTKQSDK